MNAKLIATNPHGLELRYARQKTDTWTGYDESLPLGKVGYWAGTERTHVYLGRNKTEVRSRWYQEYEGNANDL